MIFAKEKNVKVAQDSDLQPPRHIAIIMDGNGRWAKKRFLPRVAGHRKGAEAVREAVQDCSELGVEYLTLYAFSSENWSRPEDEVNDLMGLLQHYLVNEVDKLDEQNVRLSFIGKRARLSSQIRDLLEISEQRTSQNTGLNLTLALNYGSHTEILDAAISLAKDARDGKIDVENITEEEFSARLDTGKMPDPDVIIRTSGEKRLSNFLLWQAAYSEFIFMDLLWPDFNKAALVEAIEEYHKRDRRYGARPE